MRWVALILLVVNAALAAWIVAGTPGRPERGSRLPPEIGELRLLGPARAPAEPEAACFTIGPFADAAQARRAGERLAALGLDPTRRSTTDEEVHGYQVLLPPFPSREDALEATRELARKDIDEYFIVTGEPGLRNAVSVGVFRKRSHALRRAQFLDELGFDTEVHPRLRERTRYWQDYRDPQGKVTEELLGALGAGEPPQRLQRPCGGQQPPSASQ